MPELPKPHEWKMDRLRLTIKAAGVVLWAWNVDTNGFIKDEQGFALWGLSWPDKVTCERLRSTYTTPIVIGYALLSRRDG